ncbi:MAG: serine hydrolase [Pseudomonadota bacterium]|nr:serine hydrolase [Pseudomonadota bacterium]
MAKISLAVTFLSILSFCFGGSVLASGNRPTFPQDPHWARYLNNRIQKLALKTQGTIGVYIKDYSDGEIFSYNAHREWYLASAIKVPVALEVYRQISLDILDDKKPIILTDSDFRDGAGLTNGLKPGEKISLRYLLEQMLIESDNTATDLLINQVGIENINQNLQNTVFWGFGPITSLLNVRKSVFSEFDQKGFALSNRDFIALKALKKEKEKLKKLSQLLGIEVKDFKVKTISEAFNRYYLKNLNTATLIAYSKLLEKILEGKNPEPKDWPRVLDIMLKCNTGKNRIAAGLPPDVLFAHKTGTQHQRICDFGIAWKKNSGKKILISTCIEGFSELASAENALKRIGSLLKNSKIFN